MLFSKFDFFGKNYMEASAKILGTFGEGRKNGNIIEGPFRLN